MSIIRVDFVTGIGVKSFERILPVSPKLTTVNAVSAEVILINTVK